MIPNLPGSFQQHLLHYAFLQDEAESHDTETIRNCQNGSQNKRVSALYSEYTIHGQRFVGDLTITLMCEPSKNCCELKTFYPCITV